MGRLTHIIGGGLTARKLQQLLMRVGDGTASGRHIKAVTEEWVYACVAEGKRVDETPYSSLIDEAQPQLEKLGVVATKVTAAAVGGSSSSTGDEGASSAAAALPPPASKAALPSLAIAPPPRPLSVVPSNRRNPSSRGKATNGNTAVTTKVKVKAKASRAWATSFAPRKDPSAIEAKLLGR
jgi:hypothetical protein